LSAGIAASILQGDGDTVTAKVLRDQPGKVVIESIVGDNGRLSLEPSDNCIGIAATETLKLLGNPSCGVSLKLHKVRQRKQQQQQQ
jgi:homoserine kinase